MNNPLNKSIFSETGCLSRRSLLSYRDGILSRSDMHEVEKHLVDCELCSEALEGLELLTSTAVLDEISHHVTGNDRSSSSDKKPLRYLAMAASVSAVVTLSYFAIQQSQKANPSNQALNQSPTTIDKTITEPSSAPDQQYASPVYPTPSTSVLELKDVRQPDQLVVNESIKEDLQMQKDNQDAEMKSTINMVSSGTVAAHDDMATSIDVVVPSNAGEAAMPSEVLSESEVKSVERVVVAKQISTKGSRTPGATAPSAASNSYIMQEEISGNMQNLKKKESTSLNSPLELYQNKKYAEALNGFDAMIQQKSTDESALFYKGMCLYHLQRFSEASAVLEVVGKNRKLSYSDEALYHAALSFEKSGDLTSAGNILETLAAGTGSFKQKAAKRLKQLNR